MLCRLLGAKIAKGDIIIQMSDDSGLPNYKRVRDGDPDVWGQGGYNVVWGAAHGTVYSKLKNCSGVDKDLVISEVVDDVILKATALQSWDDLKRLTSRVAHCRAIDALRKVKAQKHGGGQIDSLEELLMETAAPHYKRPDDDLYNTEIWNAYRRCVQELNPNLRKLAEFRLLDELTQREISEKLQIPQGTVGVTIMKIVENVRRCFEVRGLKP